MKEWQRKKEKEWLEDMEEREDETRKGRPWHGTDAWMKEKQRRDDFRKRHPIRFTWRDVDEGSILEWKHEQKRREGWVKANEKPMPKRPMQANTTRANTTQANTEVDERRAIMRAQRFKCVSPFDDCPLRANVTLTPDNSQIDHIKAKRFDGSEELSNKWCLCACCHIKKTNMERSTAIDAWVYEMNSELGYDGLKELVYHKRGFLM